MYREQMIAAGFIEGLPERPIVGRLRMAALVACDLSPKTIDALRGKGFTHFEIEEHSPFLQSKEPMICVTYVPDLETRLREHVKEFFGKPHRLN